MSAATVFFDISHQSYVPGLVGLEHVVEGNSKLQATQSVAAVIAPAVGGALLRVITAPALLAGTVLTYLTSAAAVGRITHEETLPVIYALRVLGLDATTLGLVFSASSVGGIVGAVLANRVAHRVGEGRSVALSALAWTPAFALTPLALPLADAGVPPAATLIVGGVLASFLIVVYNVAQVSFRQRLCPPEQRGRAEALPEA